MMSGHDGFLDVVSVLHAWNPIVATFCLEDDHIVAPAPLHTVVHLGGPTVRWIWLRPARDEMLWVTTMCGNTAIGEARHHGNPER